MASDALEQPKDGGGPGPNDTADPAKSQKRKANKHTVISQFTIRNPEWSYLHLQMIKSAISRMSDESLDNLTVYMNIQSALRRFLGLYGTAMSLDIMKVEGNHAWIRAPREDADALVAALGGWIGSDGQGWKVVGWGCWGPSEGNGHDLFDDG